MMEMRASKEKKVGGLILFKNKAVRRGVKNRTSDETNRKAEFSNNSIEIESNIVEQSSENITGGISYRQQSTVVNETVPIAANRSLLFIVPLHQFIPNM